jgi:hypothetical protein
VGCFWRRVFLRYLAGPRVDLGERAGYIPAGETNRLFLIMFAEGKI